MEPAIIGRVESNKGYFELPTGEDARRPGLPTRQKRGEKQDFG